MLIKGFQKLTLLDYPGIIACTIFTGGCNFRCPYCHNASIVYNDRTAEEFTEGEILKYLVKRKGILEGICVTGGEPLLQKDIEGFLIKVKAIGYLVKLDTNGSFPDKLNNLINKGLVDFVAMDIKNSLPLYGKTIGVENFDTKVIIESAKILMEGKVDYEFRTTITKELHNDEAFEEIGKWLQGAKAFYLQNFVDSGDLIGSGLHSMDENQLNDAKTTLKRYIVNTNIRGE